MDLREEHELACLSKESHFFYEEEILIICFGYDCYPKCDVLVVESVTLCTSYEELQYREAFIKLTKQYLEIMRWDVEGIPPFSTQ